MFSVLWWHIPSLGDHFLHFIDYSFNSLAQVPISVLFPALPFKVKCSWLVLLVVAAKYQWLDRAPQKGRSLSFHFHVFWNALSTSTRFEGISSFFPLNKEMTGFLSVVTRCQGHSYSSPLDQSHKGRECTWYQTHLTSSSLLVNSGTFKPLYRAFS